jgi:hypothetical protein
MEKVIDYVESYENFIEDLAVAVGRNSEFINIGHSFTELENFINDWNYFVEDENSLFSTSPSLSLDVLCNVILSRFSSSRPRLDESGFILYFFILYF